VRRAPRTARPAVLADLLVRGGRVIDPARGVDAPCDVAIAGGRILDVAPSIDPALAARTVAATGCIVAPGLVDLHAHVFAGQDLGVDAGRYGPPAGTTTFVDAGSAGAHLFDAFRRACIEPARGQVLAFLNVSTIGTTSIRLAGECNDLRYCSLDECLRCFERHADVLVGIKVRASADAVGTNGLAPLRIAREAADRLGVPLMVHVAEQPPGIAEVLGQLRAGDILTHCFTGFGNRLVDDAGRPIPEAVAARERGVLFDVGHGARSFDASVAAAMLSHGFGPDTISSDLHAYSADRVTGLPQVLSRFLALGCDVRDLVRLATIAPARAIGRDSLASLRPGSPATMVVLEVVREPCSWEDAWGHVLHGAARLEVRMTLDRGVPTYLSLPARSG